VCTTGRRQTRDCHYGHAGGGGVHNGWLHGHDGSMPRTKKAVWSDELMAGSGGGRQDGGSGKRGAPTPRLLCCRLAAAAGRG